VTAVKSQKINIVKLPPLGNENARLLLIIRRLCVLDVPRAGLKQ